MNDYAIVFVFILSLMFLAMIFGERLSLFGIVQARWWSAPFDFVNFVWELICEAADRLWCFIFEHFWWVTATVTGTIGISLIAIMMVGGLSQEARAVRFDTESPMNAGSVLDTIPEIDTEDRQIPIMTTKVESSHVMWQFPSDNRFWVPPVVRQPIVDRRPVRQAPDRPEYEFADEKPGYHMPDYSRDQLNITLEPFVEQVGTPVRSRKLDGMIQQTMLSLRDDWRTVSQFENRFRRGENRPALQEDSQFAIDDLYSRVRVIPGEFVVENSLQVEKESPRGPVSGEFDIRLRVRNRGLETISGIVVRELLPTFWSPVDMSPRGVFRDSTVTWLLEPLASGDEAQISVRVVSSDPGEFQSFTEVSASAAVATPSKVVPARRTLPVLDPPEEPRIRRQEEPAAPRPERRTLPPVQQYPELQLTFDKRPSLATVGVPVDVRFRIENIGKVPATGVALLIDLPVELDHLKLHPTDLNRRLRSTVSRLEPGESRDRVLRVTPEQTGRFVPQASLVLQDKRLDRREFVISVRPVERTEEPLLPRPDRISQ